MQEVLIEVRGAFRRVNREQLQTLLARGFVDSETRMRIDGQDCQVKHILAQITSNSERIVPTMNEVNQNRMQNAQRSKAPTMNSEVRSVGNSVPLSNAQLVSVPVPHGSTHGAEHSGMITLEEFQAEKPPKSSSVPWIVLGILIFVFVVGGALAFVISSKNRGAKTDVAEAPPSPPTPKKSVPKPFWADRTAPFDRSVDWVSPEYSGSDVVAIFNALENFWKLEKDEFESTQEYERRVADAVENVNSRTLLGKIDFSSTIAVPLENFSQEYDADKQVLTFKFRILTNVKAKYRNSGAPSIEICRQTRRRTQEVNTEYGDKYEVVVWSTFTAYSMAPKTAFAQSVSIEMTPEKAKYLKNKTNALLVFNPDYVAIGKDKYTSVQSGDYSSSGSNSETGTENFILVKNLEFWAYSEATGEVILKQPLVLGSETK